MTCREAVALLADFLDQTLPADSGETLHAHLADCEPCRAYLKTYARTRGMVGAAGRVEMPAEMKARLRQYLLERLGDGPA